MSDEADTQRQARWRALRVAIICFVVCALFFACGGVFLADQSLRGAFVAWNKLDPPAGRPVELRLGGNGEVLLQTSEGQLYEWTRSGEEDWEAVEKPSGNGPLWGSCRTGTNSYFVVPNPPGQALQRVEATCPGPETSFHYEVVLLENDELWLWSSSAAGMFGTIYQAIIAVGGIGLSLLLGGVAYVLASISWKRGG